MISGTDEAGRGCIIGPMVIAIASIDPMDEYRLKELGVKDSKLLSKNRREVLYEQIKKICKTHSEHISAEEITELMKTTNLNDIEAIYVARLLKHVKTDEIVYIDSPDGIPASFEKRIKRFSKKRLQLVCKNKADRDHIIVGAASIIAKVERDWGIEKIKEEVGYDFNSGYTSDPITIDFIKKNLDNPILQPYLRHSWATLKKLRQKTLGDY
jgi:ribonuclease HII